MINGRLISHVPMVKSHGEELTSVNAAIGVKGKQDRQKDKKKMNIK